MMRDFKIPFALDTPDPFTVHGTASFSGDPRRPDIDYIVRIDEIDGLPSLGIDRLIDTCFDMIEAEPNRWIVATLPEPDFIEEA